MVGKDIMRFHCVYWPAFLMAAGLAAAEARLRPWLVDGRRPEDVEVARQLHPAEATGRPATGVDPVRYFMLRELPFGSDGDFSHRAVVDRLNGDLANDFGNLAQRVLAMINRNCDGACRARRARGADEALARGCAGLLGECAANIAEQAFHRALETIWQVVGEANRYVDEQAPWALRAAIRRAWGRCSMSSPR